MSDAVSQISEARNAFLDNECVMQTWSLPSSDSTSILHVCSWQPALTAIEENEANAQDKNTQPPTPPTQPYRGIVQLVHGMAEHSGRYDDFARFLVEQGYIVVSHDHIGHGKTVSSAQYFGVMPPYEGKRVLVNDTKRVCQDIKEKYPHLPFVLFGHSMGSFVARLFCAWYGKEIDAAILCGTGNQPYLLSVAGRSLARVLSKIKAPHFHSVTLDKLVTGPFSAAIEQPRTAYDWISTDEAVVDAYLADPLTGFSFAVGGYATLTDMTAEVVTKAHAAAVPHDLPLLFIAGSEDPVGSEGKGVHQAVRLYRKAGVNVVDEIIYEGMRHEILNEPQHQRVYHDIAQWIATQLVRSKHETIHRSS